MGLTDNLFRRKDPGQIKKLHRTVGGSQQYRLANTTFVNHPSGWGNQSESTCQRVTRLVIEERIDGPTLVSTSYRSSTTDFSNQICEREGYPSCVCYREACYIACDNIHCHWTGIGRVRSRCPSHPTVTFLLDLPQCPKCLGSIKEVRDRTIPVVASNSVNR